MSKTPFLIFDDYIPPSHCEDLLNDVIIIQDLEISENERQTTIQEITDMFFIEHIKKIITPIYQHINNYYNVSVQTIEKVNLTYMKHDTPATTLKAHNSVYTNNVWVRNEYNDFTISLCLTSHFNPKEKFDEMNEHIGGKIQFPQHNVSFLFERGDVIIHPSDNHFIRNVSEIAKGTLMIIDVLVSCDNLYIYQPNGFK